MLFHLRIGSERSRSFFFSFLFFSLESNPLYLNRKSWVLSSKPPKQKINVRGGILAEEMGLGKTVELISLILSHPRPTEEINIESQRLIPDYSLESGATLIISPSSIAGQWIDEIEQHAPSLSVYFYQGKFLFLFL